MHGVLMYGVLMVTIDSLGSSQKRVAFKNYAITVLIFILFDSQISATKLAARVLTCETLLCRNSEYSLSTVTSFPKLGRGYVLSFTERNTYSLY